MFGIGYQEMFIVLVVALVIFGPSRLPELAGQVGRWVRDFRRMSADLTGEFEKTFAEVDEVKKSFKREMQSIQDEVEGVGKSARGDLKKSTAKNSVAKKAPAALKAGGGTGAAGATGAKNTAPAGSKSATGSAAGNSVRPKMPALESRKRAGDAGKSTTTLNGLTLPVATKADPLVDVSFFDLDASLIVSGNGSRSNGNGAASIDEDDALSRVRRRRAAAAYGRRPSA